MSARNDCCSLELIVCLAVLQSARELGDVRCFLLQFSACKLSDDGLSLVGVPCLC